MDVSTRYGGWALILGASEGVGRAFARLLAGRGTPCILVARREAPLRALAEEIKRESALDCVTASIDLAAPEAPDRIAAAVGEREVGLLIFNAGGDPNGAPFLELGADAWAELVQRNVMTMMACAHRFAAPMRERGRGGVLLVNSGACYGGAATMGPYSGSKAFMLCFAESLWAELGPQGVEVLTLVLGRTDTPEFRRFLARKHMPLPADAASADEVARVGLDRLPYGPVHNMGQDDDQAGMSPAPAADRRARVTAVSRMIQQLYGQGPSTCSPS